MFYLTLACQIVAFLAAVLLIRHHELNRADDKDLKAATKAELLAKKMRKRAKRDTDVEAQQPVSGEQTPIDGHAGESGRDEKLEVEVDEKGGR